MILEWREGEPVVTVFVPVPSTGPRKAVLVRLSPKEVAMLERINEEARQ